MFEYKGFLEACMSCGLIQTFFETITNLGPLLYSETLGMAWQAAGILLAIWLLYQMSLYVSPILRGRVEGSVNRKEIHDWLLKQILIVAGFFTLSSEYGFGIIYSFYQYCLATGMRLAFTVISHSFDMVGAQSIIRIIQPTCQPAKTIPTLAACLGHITEASFGWIPQMFLLTVETINPTSLTFWTGVIMLSSSWAPLKNAAVSLVRFMFGGSCSLILAPMAFAFWVVPWTRGFAAAWIGEIIHSAFAVFFVGMAVMVSTVAVVALIQNSNAHYGLFFSDPLAQYCARYGISDPFSCIVSAGRMGVLQINPLHRSFWIILLILGLIAGLIGEAGERAGYWRDRIVSRA